MDNIKLTTSNYEIVLDDMLQDKGTSRTNSYFFSVTEISESTIRQYAWDKNIILKFTSIDSFISSMTFSQILK